MIGNFGKYRLLQIVERVKVGFSLRKVGGLTDKAVVFALLFGIGKKLGSVNIGIHTSKSAGVFGRIFSFGEIFSIYLHSLRVIGKLGSLFSLYRILPLVKGLCNGF